MNPNERCKSLTNYPNLSKSNENAIRTANTSNQLFNPMNSPLRRCRSCLLWCRSSISLLGFWNFNGDVRGRRRPKPPHKRMENANLSPYSLPPIYSLHQPLNGPSPNQPISLPKPEQPTEKP